MTQTAGLPHRADARRNRQKLIAVAKKAVEEHGRDVVLENVAKDAGVAIALFTTTSPPAVTSSKQSS